MTDFSTMRLGRKGLKTDYRTLRFASYIVPTLPPPLDLIDHTCGFKNWGMMANDHLGDCTIAGVGHIEQVWTLNTKPAMALISDTDIVALYSKWDGYVPGNPATDNGGYLLDVLNNWRRDSFLGRKLLAYVSVDPHNLLHVKQAAQLFGGLYVGIVLPWSAARQAVWDIVQGDGGVWGGHCVAIAGYNLTGPVCITWGALKQMTWAFWVKYCDEAYALVGEDWQGHFGGSAVNQQALLADLQAVAGVHK